MLSEKEYVILKQFERVESLSQDLIPETYLKTLVEKTYIVQVTCRNPVQCEGREQIPDDYGISTLGRDALLDFENIRQDKSKAEIQQKFDNKISVISALVPLIAFILGVIVEHYAGIASAILAFFN